MEHGRQMKCLICQAKSPSVLVRMEVRFLVCRFIFEIEVLISHSVGVGLETCLQLYRKGATVLMGCRTESKFNIARDSIITRADMKEPNGALIYIQADTSSIRSAIYAAEQILKLSIIDRLDIFIACAGRGSTIGPLNEDGVEPFFQTNCLGHLAMLQPLLPLITRTSKSSTESCRIIFVSSVAEQWSSIPWPISNVPTFASWDDINSTNRGERGLYSASKVNETPLLHGAMTMLNAALASISLVKSLR